MSPAGCPVPDGVIVSGVELEGLRHTRPGVVWQEVKHRAGAPFSCARWNEEQSRLKDLDVFGAVGLEARRSGDSVALTYRFRELPPYVPLITVGKTDQDGFSIGPHVAALNFLGTAKRVELLARFLGTTEYQASVSGRQWFGQPIEFDAAWIHVDSYNPYEAFHEDSHRFKADLFWPLWARRFGAVVMGEGFWIRSDTSGVTLRPGGDWVPRLGGGLRFDGRDRALLPRRGLFAEARLTQNGGPLGGPADFREWLVDLRGYIPVAGRLGVALNGLYQYRDDSIMGRYDDFHVGGANTLRGYEDNAYQGRSECLVNTEARVDLVKERVQSLARWSASYALQWVAGSDVVGTWIGKRASPPIMAIGFYGGLHLLLPGVERVRLEIGYTGDDVRVHLGLFEKTTAQRWRTR